MPKVEYFMRGWGEKKCCRNCLHFIDNKCDKGDFGAKTRFPYFDLNCKEFEMRKVTHL